MKKYEEVTQAEFVCMLEDHINEVYGGSIPRAAKAWGVSRPAIDQWLDMSSRLTNEDVIKDVGGARASFKKTVKITYKVRK